LYQNPHLAGILVPCHFAHRVLLLLLMSFSGILLILDELSVQGLVLWLDDNGRRQWRWQGTDLKSTQGFWAMGEALVDAVNGRFPETFSIPNYNNAIEQKKAV